MPELPNTLEDAIAQAREATKAAIADGYTRIMVELLFPELKAMPMAQQFLPTFEGKESNLKLFFPDTGAAALARREWGEVPFKIDDLGSSRSPAQAKVKSEDEVFLLVEPSSVEITQVEQLCQAAGDRPVVLFLPRLEDAGTVGIGYAARQLRDRFLKTLDTAYYIRPIEGAAIFRCYPSPWQVWLETDDTFQLISETPQRPVGDDLDRILNQATNGTEATDTPKPQRKGLMAGMQRFLRALSQ